MAIRKSDDIENETNSRYSNVKTTKSRTRITKRFDDSTHNPYPGDEALQYLNKKLDDVIDLTNTNDSKIGITGNTLTNNIPSLTISKDRSNNLVISDGTSTWTITADR